MNILALEIGAPVRRNADKNMFTRQSEARHGINIAWLGLVDIIKNEFIEILTAGRGQRRVDISTKFKGLRDECNNRIRILRGYVSPDQFNTG